ncbi:MAG: hypothetical protein KBC41_00605 [Candidatus Pacebacteria bacterium]|nr:hypothetical protein [Candidatus Paceibacterota bacterium]MBP9866564.1 hypothetical protein [Candidatus Paceibacterota bacterium]
MNKCLFVPLLVCILFSIGSTYVFSEEVSISDTVTATAIVIERTISPAPPVLPNPVSNNGVPLTIEAGVDSAIFKGYAYPKSSILLMKNGLIVHETPANIDGTFEIPVRNILPGTYTFNISAKDSSGIVSAPATYTILITSGVVTEISGIHIPPTITSDKVEVKLGDDITFSGKSIPKTEVHITFFAKSGITKIVTANEKGEWSYTFPTSNLDYADYNVKARSKILYDYTGYSETILFKISTSNKLRTQGKILTNARCDLNNDSRVNLLDFSIMAFWYKRIGFPAKVDLNSDTKINLTDLSILAYCWTG